MALPAGFLAALLLAQAASQAQTASQPPAPTPTPPPLVIPDELFLEFSLPRSPLVRAGYLAYFRHLLPLVGRLVSGHRSAYQYLPDSVAHFPTGDVLAARLRAAGFARVAWEPLTFGIAAIHVATKAA